MAEDFLSQKDITEKIIQMNQEFQSLKIHSKKKDFSPHNKPILKDYHFNQTLKLSKNIQINEISLPKLD
jgi:hypothetical protein